MRAIGRGVATRCTETRNILTPRRTRAAGRAEGERPPVIRVVFADDLPARYFERQGVRVGDFTHHLIGPVFKFLFG